MDANCNAGVGNHPLENEVLPSSLAPVTPEGDADGDQATGEQGAGEHLFIPTEVQVDVPSPNLGGDQPISSTGEGFVLASCTGAPSFLEPRTSVQNISESTLEVEEQLTGNDQLTATDVEGNKDADQPEQRSADDVGQPEQPLTD